MWNSTLLMNSISLLVAIAFVLLGNASFVSALVFTHIGQIDYLFIIYEAIGRFAFVRLLINIIL